MDLLKCEKKLQVNDLFTEVIPTFYPQIKSDKVGVGSGRDLQEKDNIWPDEYVLVVSTHRHLFSKWRNSISVDSGGRSF